MGSYYRITYTGKGRGCWEDIQDESTDFSLHELSCICKQRGAIPINDEKVMDLLLKLKESGRKCLWAAAGITVNTVYVEYRTTSEVM